MKKIYSIFAAGVLAILALSCVKEENAVFDASKATAPVLGSYELGEEAITATYTPATFKLGFNEKIAPNHTLALVSLDGQKVSKTLTTSDKDGVLTLKNVNLAKALMTLGKSEGSTASVELAVRASMQEPSKDNGRNGYVDSDGHITIGSFEVVIPEIVGSPYADYTQDSEWSVIGALSAYEISWDGDLNMWTDGNNHVAAHVTLKAGDEFKFRKDADWAVNYGGDFGGLDTEFSVTQDGPNIKVGADGVYDLYLNPTDGVAWITAAYDPLPDFTESSSWSVIGALSLHDISWNGDIAMISDGTWHVALGVNLAAADEFKFRKDADWAVNMGGDFTGLGDEFAVSQDGPNIKVGADGSFDLYVNPDAGLAKVTEASGAKVSAKIGGNEEPEPEPVTGWNIIGLNGDWNNDILATENEGVWTAYITAEGDTEFKWRKDAGWDENYGGVFVELGKPFEAVPGGDNIKIGAGFWKVELNTNDKTITISNGQVWSLIGVNGDWNTDIDMVLTDGKWVSPVTKIKGEFKLRENHGWDNNRGGAFVAVGEPFAAVAGGDNISVEEGNYVVTYDPTAETIVVDETGWGLVGTINGWGNSPDIILKEDGNFLVARNVALTDSDEIKIRYKSSWDVNRGGATNVGHAVKAVPGGDNIKPGVAGNYDIWYRPDSEVLFVMPAGTELTYWGVVGTINSWGQTPDHIMYETAAGQFVFEDLEITASDEIKIRQNENWDNNRGGNFGELAEPFAVEGNGPNIKVGRDAKVTVTYDPAAETITLTGEYQGDAPVKPAAWSLIGTLNGTSWDTDFDLQNTSGDIWVIKNVAVTANDEFKIRADHAWSTSVGGPEGNDASTIDPGNPYDVYKPVLGTAFAAGDKNIHIGVEGVYTVTFDYAAQTILIEEYKEYPEHLYMIGEEFGSWDWGSDGVVEMTPVLHHPDWGATAPGQFWTVRYFHAGKGFKYCAQRKWEGDFWGLQNNDGFTESGGNCTVAEDGFYLVHVDFANSKVHVEPARIYGIGDCFGGWNEEMSGALFAAADGKVSQTVTNDGNVRMYVASAIATSPWWTREFNVFDGKIVYRGAGGDQDAVPVKAGDKVTLDFNAGTGTIGADGGQGGAVKITIDGDMSDWAGVTTGVVTEADPGVYQAFKVYNDDNNIYFYSKRDNRDAIWGGNGYFYYDIDADNNAETGVEKDGIGGLETWMYIKPFAGSADAPAFATEVKGDAHPSKSVIANLHFSGLNSESYVEVEVSVPLADAGVKKGDTILVYSWSNKDGYDVQKKPVTITIK